MTHLTNREKEEENVKEKETENIEMKFCKTNELETVHNPSVNQRK